MLSGKSLAGATQAELDEVARKLNDPPCQTLGFSARTRELTPSMLAVPPARVALLANRREVSLLPQRPELPSARSSRTVMIGWLPVRPEGER